MPKTLRMLGVVAAAAAVAALVAGGWLYSRLKASLPLLDGSAAVPGLTAPVTIERDALGVPTIRGRSRADVARALGFAHGQDRFFQMDLLRRRAAGELAELFGKAAVGIDKTSRRHGFRRLARAEAAAAPPEEKAVVEAYAAGVNEGLSALRAKPFEYSVLRTEPEAWKPEDCVLVGYAMTLTLQYEDGRYERSLTELRDAYGLQVMEFFSPALSAEDAALDGTRGELPAIPPAKLIDLRTAASAPVASISRAREFIPGSNSMAVAGSRSSSGAAVLANDMHLDLAVPNTWYRARLEWEGRSVTGVTLPGTPLVVAGSNGKVAWGFTNACADTGDLVMITPSDSPGIYRVPPPQNLREIEKRKETIQVKGALPVEVTYDWTIWGPIVGEDVRGHPLAHRWMADDPGMINFGLLAMEAAGTAEEAMAVARRAGIPAQNILVADSAGHIGWTIAGRLPKREGYDGRLPVSWLFGDRGWKGILAPDEVPSVRDPDSGYLWTANNRILGGDAFRRLGDGGYERPARAAQIRDDLSALVRAGRPVGPKDLLAIELDDRALFLSRWQAFLLEALSPQAAASDKSRAELRALAQRWDNRASVESTSYGVVRAFRTAVAHRVLDPVFAPCVEADPGFDWGILNYEDALWAIVHSRPPHLLPPGYGSWEDLFAAAADDAGRTIRSEAGALDKATWGRHNALRIVHPFSRAMPRWLTGWLNMPEEPVPGDGDMPRIQGPEFGASERFAVSPGHEEDGIFEMPCGQSGHPLSPFYRAGHEAWVRGEPAPFLPGPAVHRLVLLP